MPREPYWRLSGRNLPPDRERLLMIRRCRELGISTEPRVRLRVALAIRRARRPHQRESRPASSRRPGSRRQAPARERGLPDDDPHLVLAALSAVGRARIYELAELDPLERIESEERVRALIARAA